MRSPSALVLTVALLAGTPFSPLQKATPQPRAKATISTPSVPPTKGDVEHGTYKNPSIGLEFTPAEDLHFQEPQMKGTPGTTPLLITIQALADPGLSDLFWARSLTIFYADALSYYPEDQRTDARYLEKVVRANEGEGFQHIDGDASGHMSGITFVRADFVKKEVHETILLTTRNVYAFVFIFAGSDLGVTNKLIASTKVKLGPPLSQSTAP
jgi:hypothetical protein